MKYLLAIKRSQVKFCSPHFIPHSLTITLPPLLPTSLPPPSPPPPSSSSSPPPPPPPPNPQQVKGSLKLLLAQHRRNSACSDLSNRSSRSSVKSAQSSHSCGSWGRPAPGPIYDEIIAPSGFRIGEAKCIVLRKVREQNCYILQLLHFPIRIIFRKKKNEYVCRFLTLKGS